MEKESLLGNTVYHIKTGSNYFLRNIQKLESELQKTTDGRKNEQIRSKISYLERASFEHEKNRQEVETELKKYESAIEKHGRFYHNDFESLKLIEYLSGKKISTYVKEENSLEKTELDSRKKFEDIFSRNADFLVDNSNTKLMKRTWEDINGQTHKISITDIIKAVEQNSLKIIGSNIYKGDTQKINSIDSPEVKKQLRTQQEYIASQNPEYQDLNTVLDRNNNVNLSTKDEARLSKCKDTYLDIAKHTQTIEKINEALKRFGIGITEEEYLKNPNLEKFRGRDKNFSKTCQSLQKLREKEQKKIAKLEKKATKLYTKGNVKDIAGVINGEKKLEADKQQKSNLDIKIEKKQQELKALNQEYVKLANKKYEWDHREGGEQKNLGSPMGSLTIEVDQDLTPDEEQRLKIVQREISEIKEELASMQTESEKLDNEISSAQSDLDTKKESNKLKGYFNKQPAIVKSSEKTAAQRFDDEYRVDNLPSTPLHSDKSQNNDEPVKTSEPNKDDDDFMVE